MDLLEEISVFAHPAGLVSNTMTSPVEQNRSEIRLRGRQVTRTPEH